MVILSLVFGLGRLNLVQNQDQTMDGKEITSDIWKMKILKTFANESKYFHFLKGHTDYRRPTCLGSWDFDLRSCVTVRRLSVTKLCVEQRCL